MNRETSLRGYNGAKHYCSMLIGYTGSKTDKKYKQLYASVVEYYIPRMDSIALELGLPSYSEGILKIVKLSFGRHKTGS